MKQCKISGASAASYVLNNFILPLSHACYNYYYLLSLLALGIQIAGERTNCKNQISTLSFLVEKF